MRRLTGISAGRLLLATVLIAVGVILADDAPLSLEDVVRMHARGDTPEQILQRIADAPVDFDLSPEMIAELKRAGLSVDVIDAMQARQAEMKRQSGELPDTEALEAEIARADAALAVVVERSAIAAGAPGDLIHPTRIDERFAEQHGFKSGQTPELTDLALFVACRTADHVPDQWRSKSPLGRDFVLAPRHRMLIFESGARRVPAKELSLKQRLALKRLGTAERPVGLLALDLPDRMTADVGGAGLAHDLVVGIAGEADGRFIALLLSERGGVVVPRGGTELALHVDPSKSATRGVRLIPPRSADGKRGGRD